MTDLDAPTASLARIPPSHGRPVRKDEIELHERGLYIESWLPERRSRRKPLLFVHGELGGSWVWERYLGYFAGRGWEGHALNLRNHFWSQTADPDELDVRDVHRGRRRGASSGSARASSPSATGWAGCSPSRPPSGSPVCGLVLIAPELPARPPRAGARPRLRDGPRGLRPVAARLGDAAREAAARRTAT